MEILSQSGSDENFAGVIRIEEGKIRSHVDQVVRETVEQTLNGLLEAEADDLCGAKRYARSPERLDTRAGHYDRKLHTKAGEVTLQVPRLRNLPFETEIIERYRRREAAWKKPWSRCTWPACRSDEWRTSPKPCGARGSVPARSAS